MLPTVGMVVGVVFGALTSSGGELHAGDVFAAGDAPRRMLLMPAGDGGSMEEERGGTSGEARPERTEHALRTHRTLSVVTTGSLLVTAALGTLTAINEGTAFHDGRCTTGHPLLGDYGCESLHIVHGASAILSVVLYTATAVQGLPLGLNQSEGPLYRILSYVHLVGIVLQPILGLITSYPEVIGINPGAREHFGDVMRTIHIGVGYVTVAAYATTTVLEF
ncbi:hypothetical protein [Vitiosangium sp. GDMCC 1.1324]|uniref:hypothetical protein n=1 Tax=Vitiosangium sp. (strain GDMCC 1.1324) TaxID=2138576 RepID=UPI000D391236|nr:hypothetical protein [Vitiosangium sp. GDMCC 1.1324]PTL79493.1 hypothetical protein DAT35_32270 [Vitiosangium sp. GDMCC 1.1324]